MGDKAVVDCQRRTSRVRRRAPTPRWAVERAADARIRMVCQSSQPRALTLLVGQPQPARPVASQQKQPDARVFPSALSLQAPPAALGLFRGRADFSRVRDRSGDNGSGIGDASGCEPALLRHRLEGSGSMRMGDHIGHAFDHSVSTTASDACRLGNGARARAWSWALVLHPLVTAVRAGPSIMGSSGLSAIVSVPTSAAGLRRARPRLTWSWPSGALGLGLHRFGSLRRWRRRPRLQRRLFPGVGLGASLHGSSFRPPNPCGDDGAAARRLRLRRVLHPLRSERSHRVERRLAGPPASRRPRNRGWGCAHAGRADRARRRDRPPGAACRSRRADASRRRRLPPARRRAPCGHRGVPGA